MSAYESDERSQLKEDEETHLWSRTIALSNYVKGGNAFHDGTKYTSDMKYSRFEVTYQDEGLYNLITKV